MGSLPFVLSYLLILLASSPVIRATDNSPSLLLSNQTLHNVFTPPQFFRNKHLVRKINLEKVYTRETINVVIENVDEDVQDEYYLPFETSSVSQIGSLEVRDKLRREMPPFSVEPTTYSLTELYCIRLPRPLQPSEQQTLSISYSVLSAVKPRPRSIDQRERQYLEYNFSAYVPSVYTTLKQKTKLKFLNAEIPDYTVLPALRSDSVEDPTKQGTSFTYGPYDDIPAGIQSPVSVRYEFTKPLIHVTRLERDLEISHWGGNLATEERYWLTNRGASLKNNFSRVQWQMGSYASPRNLALSVLNMPLQPSSTDAYFTDDIGNVSTSRFGTTPNGSNLEIRPRYPVFGSWKYSFRVGWNRELSFYLRRFKSGNDYVLKIPFIEGPNSSEGIEYERVDLRIILPEGTRNVQFETKVPIISNETTLHRAFMDTAGRRTIYLSALNLNDQWRDHDLVLTYDYPFAGNFRKPITATLVVFAIFTAAWALGRIDTSIEAEQRTKVLK